MLLDRSSRLLTVSWAVAFGPTSNKRITVLFSYDVNRAIEIETTETAKNRNTRSRLIFHNRLRQKRTQLGMRHTMIGSRISEGVGWHGGKQCIVGVLNDAEAALCPYGS